MSGKAAVEAGFGDLLRSLRLEAGLTQELLAERADISTDAVSAYERQLRTAPRKDTIALLAEALQLTGDVKAAFENAATRGARPLPSDASHNLPWQPTSFIGRCREIEAITGLLCARRLVTVTGSGGIGKTRTVVEVASRLPRLPGEMYFVDLAPVLDDSLVLSKLASVLGLQLPTEGDPLWVLVAAIKTRRLLLIFDNCEHVLPAIRELSVAILATCPQITLMATSRERLDISGERVYRLSTLAIPTKGREAASEIRSFAALELLVKRAAEHGFLISNDDMEIAADICRRLDGIALAIELAAARLPVLGLSELRAQLTKHFKMISGARQDVAARQRALDTMISWSHDLLDERERVLFRRLAIFSSGWTLEAAASVCSDGALSETAACDTLFSLVEKSLVQVDLDVTPPRYSFFESTRTYALERLGESGEGPRLSRRHEPWIALATLR